MTSVPVFPGAPRKNDALFLYGAMQDHPFVYTYEQLPTEVVYGPSCKVDNEIDTETCIQKGVPFLERRSGGGTVVLSPGMVVTVIVHKRDKTDGALDTFGRIHGKMIELLESENIRGIEKRGISDLALKGKKILGSSLYLGTRPMLYYYQSSLMISSDLSLIPHFLKHPPREPDYREGRSHDEFCTTLNKEGYTITPKEIAQLFSAELGRKLDS